MSVVSEPKISVLARSGAPSVFAAAGASVALGASVATGAAALGAAGAAGGAHAAIKPVAVR